MDMEHETYMRRCIQLAKCGAWGAPPNPMVGAVVVHKGKVIGEGYHRCCGGPHAEVNAIARVQDKSLLKECTLYVSLEPCAHYGKTPPCADLIIFCGIPKVVVGCRDSFAKVNGLGIRKMEDAGIEVTVGVLERECLSLNRKFFTFHGAHRPWITLKWAQSRDGYIDGPRDEHNVPVLFSTSYTRMLVHRMRAAHQAIMVGTHTALMDNPTLTTRYWPGENPLRVTIDRNGVLPSSLHLMDDSVPTLVYRTGNLNEIMTDLYERGVQSLLVEGGRSLLQSFIEASLWDEARVEYAPVVLGSGVEVPKLYAAEMDRVENHEDHSVVFYTRSKKKDA